MRRDSLRKAKRGYYFLVTTNLVVSLIAVNSEFKNFLFLGSSITTNGINSNNYY